MVYSVEFDSFLGIISDYWANNPDWWSANKIVLDPSALWRSLAELSRM